jgi:hypothetical protein
MKFRRNKKEKAAESTAKKAEKRRDDEVEELDAKGLKKTWLDLNEVYVFF